MKSKLFKIESKRIQLIVMILLIITLFSAFLILYFPNKFKTLSLQKAGDEDYIVTKVMANNIESALMFNDKQALEEGLASFYKISNFQALVVLDTNGKLIHSINSKKFINNNRNENYVDYENGYIQTGVPVVSGHSSIGHLITQFSLNSIKEEISETRISLVYVSVFIFLLGLFLSIIVGRIFTSPLDKLKKNFEDIAKLNLNKRAEVEGNDEFSALARSFNLMIDKLDTAYSDINEINKNLENKVSERTDKLKKEIDQRKNTELSLLATNQLITGIINSSPLPILTLNDEGKILSTSPTYFELLGTEPESKYLTIPPLKDENERNKYFSAIKECISNNSSTTMHLTFNNSDKDIIVRINFSPIPKIGENEEIKIIAIIDNITDRIEKEIALIESEEKYRNLVDNAKVGIGIFYDTNKSFANSYLLDMLGLNNIDEFYELDLDSLIPEPYKEIYVKIIDINHISATPYELEILNNKGETIYSEITKSVVYLNDNNYLQLAFINVTDRVIYFNELKKLNAELEQRVENRTKELNNTLLNLQKEIQIREAAEEKLRMSDRILRQVAALVLVADKNANIIYSTPFVEELLGYRAEEVLNQGWWEIYKITDMDMQKEKEYIQQCASRKIAPREKSYENVFFTKDMKRKWIQWRDVIGDNDTIVTVGNDITFQIETNEKLKIATDELQKALEKEKELGDLKIRFISMISHEYRTPLTIILSSASIISKLIERQEYHKIKEFTAKIESSVQNMVKLLEDVLSISKNEDSKTKVQLFYLNLEMTVKQILSDIKLSNKYENEYNLDIVGDFKEVFTDEKLILQILNNLISNAFKYSPNKMPIYIRLSDEKQYYKIYVKDNGIGIPQDSVANLFESFYRANNVGAISGTGLGMPIVKRAVDALQGTIEVKSEENCGSEFTVKLPYLNENI